MKHPQCIMTGCDFFDPVEQRWCRADLHRVGDAYVANAVTTAAGNVSWIYGPPRPGEMVVSADSYFEKRGIIVFDKEAATFNDHAEQHLRPVSRRLC